MTNLTPIVSRTGITALFGLAALAVAAHAVEPALDKRVVKPAHGASFDAGSKHIVSYFIAQNGACDVTLLIGDKADEDGDFGSIGTRVKFAVPAGMTARTDTAEGKSLEIGCASGASAMSIRPVDLMAYAAPVK